MRECCGLSWLEERFVKQSNAPLYLKVEVRFLYGLSILQDALNAK